MSATTESGRAVASGRNNKSADAFRTISEVAKELDVPQHVLRFWETKFTQVKPLKRGGGRRYYRPEDIALLDCIRDLLYTEGYTIKGVQKLLRESGVKAIVQGSEKRGRPLQPFEVENDGRLPGAGSGAYDDEDELDLGSPGEDDVAVPAAARSQLESILDELVQLRALLSQKQD